VNRWRLRRVSARSLIYGGALLLVCQAAFPFFWMVSTSFKPPAEVFAQPPGFIPQEPTWDNFHRLFTTTHFLVYFRNSVIVCGLTVLLTWRLVLPEPTASPGIVTLVARRSPA